MTRSELPLTARRLIEDHIESLRRAGVSEQDIEFAREVLTDGALGKVRETGTEDELILAINAWWDVVRDVHKRKGTKL